MKQTILNNCKIVTQKKIIKCGSLEFTGNKITKISLEKNPSPKAINLKGKIVFPGFIDPHTHGGYGYDWTNLSIEKLKEFSKKLTSEGITSFCLTTTADKEENLLNFLKFIKNYLTNNKQNEGAVLLGINLEGPFLDHKKAGAHLIKNIKVWNSALFKKLIKTSGKNIRILNYHPTLLNIDVPKILRKNNILGALGHSSSTALTAEKHIDLGINHLTHFYNACSEFNHRIPGITFLGLKNKKIYLELICDQYHLNKDVIKFTYEVRTARKIILITDSTFMKGLKDGNYLFAGQSVKKEKNKLVTEKEKKLAGSCLTFNEAFSNIMKITNCTLKEAQYMTSINIATQLKLSDTGFLAVGMNADLIILSKNHDLLATFVKGKKFFDKKNLFSNSTK